MSECRKCTPWELVCECPVVAPKKKSRLAEKAARLDEKCAALETALERESSKVSYMVSKEIEEASSWLGRIQELETEMNSLSEDHRDVLQANQEHVRTTYFQQQKIKELETALNKIYDIAILGTNKGSIEVTRIIAKLDISK